MRIKSKFNGGIAVVSDEQAEGLIASGYWVAADEPKPAPAPAPKKRAPRKKVEPKE
ncbi:hypothetical protein SEA_SHAM4_17 [Mycobacterium phage Sham4]|uniref:head-tail connector protein n=1 Tax=Mycobacterium phage Mulciber TaxID=1805459 RepID=UPI00078BBF87|nr:head-tail connector protein [Mycobacterium phage Mulciber]AQT28209.1 hypothetical protein SEA_JABITH_17 [Mycobacterium phage Jabith]AXH50697.1 hypothetical protein SEA_SNAPE_17 [Mycobacterium phage Snape]QBI99049.1 hypothetical protein SEA_SALZ_17 [Mycobacterium phage Salz]QFG04996.1 hypothetical protein SEA_HUTC2_17 [Mycobacterium phage Hutc2]QPX61942.1 hypothetical protein SEA_FLAVERINT_17 [Mycobacterium phage Flaverint]UOW92663.1 hypothetical protein SEA_SHAM4_17 [Mycobacterium phage Sh